MIKIPKVSENLIVIFSYGRWLHVFLDFLNILSSVSVGMVDLMPYLIRLMCTLSVSDDVWRCLATVFAVIPGPVVN